MFAVNYVCELLLQVVDQPFLLQPRSEESGCEKPRKCAVIDLDETLVHSSFAVSSQHIIIIIVIIIITKTLLEYREF